MSVRTFARPGRHPDDRAIASLAVPALGALAADPLYSLVDTALVGHLGVAELGALGVGTAAFTASFWIFSFLAYGVTPRVAGAVGAGDMGRAALIGRQAIVLAILLGAGVSAAGVLFAGPVVRLFGASGEVAGHAETYLSIRVLAAAPVLLTQVGQGYLRGLQDTRTPTLIVVTGAIVNGLLAYVLIYPAGLGVAGAAWAVVAVQAGVAAAFLVVMARGMHGAPWRPHRAVLRSLAKAGVELTIRTGSLLAALTVATSVAARMGTGVLASWQIGMQVFLLLSLTMDSVAIAAQSMIGKLLGAGQPGRARELSARLIGLGTFTGLVLLATVLVLAPVAGEVFTDDAEVARRAGWLLVWLAFLQPLAAVAFTLDGILIGASDTRFLARSMAGSSVAFVAGSLLALQTGAGVAGLAAAMTVWIGARAVWTGLRWRSAAWAA